MQTWFAQKCRPPSMLQLLNCILLLRWELFGGEKSGSLLPDKLPAVRAVGGLPQVRGHKLVSIDLVDSPSHSPLALPGKMFEDSVSLESSCILKEREKKEV